MRCALSSPPAPATASALRSAPPSAAPSPAPRSPAWSGRSSTSACSRSSPRPRSSFSDACCARCSGPEGPIRRPPRNSGAPGAEVAGGTWGELPVLARAGDEGWRRRGVVGAALADRPTRDDVVVLGQLAEDTRGAVGRRPAVHDVEFDQDLPVLAFPRVADVRVGPDRVVADHDPVAGVEGVPGVRHGVEELQRRARVGGLARPAGDQVVLEGDVADLAVLDEEALGAGAAADPVAAEDQAAAA